MGDCSSNFCYVYYDFGDRNILVYSYISRFFSLTCCFFSLLLVQLLIFKVSPRPIMVFSISRAWNYTAENVYNIVI